MHLQRSTAQIIPLEKDSVLTNQMVDLTEEDTIPLTPSFRDSSFQVTNQQNIKYSYT